MKNLIVKAVAGCRLYALSIFLVYCTSCTVGILMAHGGNQFAISARDNIVGAAQTDKTASNYQSGNRLAAAFYDFGGNVFMAAIPQTAIGLTIVLPYFTVACQGWIGGIVSVDGSHQSRFTSFQSSAYYFIVLFLQFAAFSLTIGAGVKCGVDTYKHNAEVGLKLWKFRIPKESLVSVGYVYLVSLPIFLVASCFEFLSSWNM